jgi:hypothetical protein
MDILRKPIKRKNKFIPELDLTINKIEYPFKEEKYFIVEFSLYESLGELGKYYTEFYKKYPTEEELIKDIKEHLKEVKKDFKNSILTAIEERYLKILDRMNIQKIRGVS